MLLDDFLTLRLGEVIVFTSIDMDTNEYCDYMIGDELVFLDSNRGYYNFLRKGKFGNMICHFTEGVHSYIERKVVIERELKLKEVLYGI